MKTDPTAPPEIVTIARERMARMESLRQCAWFRWDVINPNWVLITHDACPNGQLVHRRDWAAMLYDISRPFLREPREANEDIQS